MLDAEAAPATMEQADAALIQSTPEAAPETSDTPVSQPETQAPDGRPRNELGQFTSTPTAEPEATPEVAPADAPEATGEPVVESAPETQTYPTFRYKADGQEYEIPGSAHGDEGLFIPKTHVGEVQQLLSAGRAANGSVRARLSEAAQKLQAAEARVAAAEAQAQHITSHFENLIQSGNAAEWLEGVRINWPVLQAEAKARAVEMQSDLTRKQLDEYRQRDEQVRLKPLMDQTLEQSVAHHGQQVGLDADGIAELHQLLKDPMYQNVLFVRAPFDDPQNGIKQGELVIDHSVVQRHADTLKKWQSRFGPKAQPAQQKIAAAQKANAALEPTKKIPVPPTVGAKGTRPPRPAIPQPKTAREADDLLMHGDLSAFID